MIIGDYVFNLLRYMTPRFYLQRSKAFLQRRYLRNDVGSSGPDRSHPPNMWSLVWESLASKLRFIKSISSMSARIVTQPVALVNLIRRVPHRFE